MTPLARALVAMDKWWSEPHFERAWQHHQAARAAALELGDREKRLRDIVDLVAPRGVSEEILRRFDEPPQERECSCARAATGSTRCDVCGHDLGCRVHSADDCDLTLAVSRMKATIYEACSQQSEGSDDQALRALLKDSELVFRAALSTRRVTP
jgi:hypothetical protein